MSKNIVMHCTNELVGKHAVPHSYKNSHVHKTDVFIYEQKLVKCNLKINDPARINGTRAVNVSQNYLTFKSQNFAII